ncbi:MAG TPA: YhfC family glutamic-type intramembrane protease [Terriglobales bacterium]|nr:YhfC family glutamic-type intramembrane protease [Terriglobales bacterium]
MVQNIDPLFILQPIIVIAFSVGIVLYWRRKHPFGLAVLGFSLLAYAGAIIAKLLFQYATVPLILPLSAPDWVLGLYLGLQTVVFEVGGAFLVARYAVARKLIDQQDAEAYGLSLAMWENAGLLGVVSLANLLFYVAILSNAGPVAESLYTTLSKTQPGLFYGPLQVAPLIAWGTIERVSSLLAHFSWGYLCVMAAYLHKKEYLMLALPMGMIDFLVPFAGLFTVPIFECIIFVISVICLIVSLEVTKSKKTSRKRRT